MATPSPDAPPFPQLEFSYWPSQILWTLVALTALYFVLSRFALPRVASTLEERQDTIASDLDQAAEFDRKAKEAKEAYEQALADARVEAQKIADRTRAEIAEQTAEAMAKADAQIAVKAEESAKRLAEIRIDSAERAKE
ncbi:MAG: F0F1 ATP synthase subunit B', partial [Pseudomonadota bacterium]